MSLRRMLLATTLLLVSAALAGCADNGGTTTTPTGSTTTPTTTPTTGATDKTPTISAIKVGSDAAYPPFEDTLANGSIVGFDVDVLTEVGRRAGFTVEFQNSGFNNIIPSVMSGTFDVGASAFTITDERKQQVDFSVPYYENSLLVAVTADEDGITDEESLRSVKVCTQTGTTSEFYLRENLGHTNDTLLIVDLAPQCKDALLRGDVDALMIDAAFVRNVVESSDGQLKEAFDAIDADEQFGFVVAKGKTELLTAINDALVAMKSDGKLDELVDKWQV